MKAVPFTFVMVLITLASVFGCSTNETPTSPTSPKNDPHEFVAMVNIDSCTSRLPDDSGGLDGLCGGTSEIRGSFEFVYPATREEEHERNGVITKRVTYRTGPGVWAFSNEAFGDVLADHFEGRPLKIVATRTVVDTVGGPASDMTEVFLRVWSGTVTPYQENRLTMQSPTEMPIDANGFPSIGEEVMLSGPLRFTQYGGPYQTAAGSANLRIKNLHVLPIRHKSEPPEVERPTLRVQQLRAAPSTLQFGNRTLVFNRAVASRWQSGAAPLDVFIEILEENFYMVDEVRMDFVWLVHESGIWEPEIGSIWNTHRFGAHASDGPLWPLGTAVDIVVGFTDMSGDVHLMKATTTVRSSF